MSTGIKTCPRCRKPLSGKTVNFLDRHYHEVCYVVILVHYKTIKDTLPRDLKGDSLHDYLYYSQPYYKDLD